MLPLRFTYVKRLGVYDSVYVIRSCANGRAIGASTVNVGQVEVVGWVILRLRHGCSVMGHDWRVH